MVKKSTLESILQNEMSDFWALLDSEEKHVLSDNFVIQNFKKNEIIYCEGDQPLQLMYLLKGKVKVYKKGIGDRNQIIRLIRPVNTSDTEPILPTETMSHRERPSKHHK